jgi:hypothetical protein
MSAVALSAQLHLNEVPGCWLPSAGQGLFIALRLRRPPIALIPMAIQGANPRLTVPKARLSRDLCPGFPSWPAPYPAAALGADFPYAPLCGRHTPLTW